MIARKLKHKLPLKFTGGLIVDTYSFSNSPYVLIIFKEGKVIEYLTNISYHYEGKELPIIIINWLKKNGFGEMPIYTDSSKIVSRDDYDRILGYDAVGRLEDQMSCVKTNKLFRVFFNK